VIYKNYQQMLEIINQYSPKKFTISVAAAADPEVLSAVKRASEIGLATAVLVGDKNGIKKINEDLELGLEDITIIDEPDPVKASMEAVRQVRIGNADSLMKGLVNTSDFMSAVLDKENGLRTGRMLSHLAALDLPLFERILYISDGGLNIIPTLEEKKKITQNAIDHLIMMGYELPKVAILSANEVVSPKQPVTIDAAALKEMAERGEITGAVVEGPMPLDMALDREAAIHKKAASQVAGSADLLIAPTIEVGNILGKSMIYCGHAVMAGLILGAQVPIILTSRAATLEMKIASIALAALPGAITVMESMRERELFLA